MCVSQTEMLLKYRDAIDLSGSVTVKNCNEFNIFKLNHLPLEPAVQAEPRRLGYNLLESSLPVLGVKSTYSLSTYTDKE